MAVPGSNTFLIGSARGLHGQTLCRWTNRHRRAQLCPALLLLFILTTMSAATRAADPSPNGGTSAVQEIDWQTSPLDLDLRGMNGERYAFHCPAGKPQPSRVTGSGPYTDDSSICSAAVHAGLIHAKDGGEVAIEIRPGQDTYIGSEHNYIHSASYDHAWSGGFVVIKTDTGTSQAAFD
jgi:hypothetical protein